MSNYTNENLINVPSYSVPAGTLAIKVGDNVFTTGNVQAGGSTDFYKCTYVSSDSSMTWKGRKAVLNNGVYSFQSNSTSGLHYDQVKPVVGNSYSTDALIQGILYQGRQIPQQGLIFYTSLKQASQTAQTGQTLVSSTTFTYSSDSGIPCVITPGDAYIEADLSAATSSINQVSYSFWFKFYTPDDLTYYPIAFGNDGSYSRLALYYISGYGGLNVNYGGQTLQQPANIDISKWNHLLLTHDYSTNQVKAYANGVLFTSDTKDLNLSSGSIYLFTRPDHNYSTPSGGKMAAVRVYSRVLTAEQIAILASQFTPTD